MTWNDPATAGQPTAKGRLRIGMLLAGVLVAIVCIAAKYFWPAETASANPATQSIASTTAGQPQPPGGASVPPAGVEGAKLQIMAVVNGQEITRNELAGQCLKHYGDEVLQRVMRKYLVMQECQRRNIAVTQSEVNTEIDRMATRFSLPVDQWLKMLKAERGITPEQYSSEIVWPTLALRKLAGQRLQVDDDDIRKQFEAQYGPAVKARLIVVEDPEEARNIQAHVAANPDSFGTVAKDKSVDVASASVKGLIPPIRLHVGHKEIEDIAFKMEEGAISPVIQVGNQYAIIKCEGKVPPQRVSFEQVKMSLIDTIRDGKMRKVADEIFNELKQNANVVNLLDDPARRAQMPGVAALINGQRIDDRELAELCIDRHGEKVLEGSINLKLLEQACKRQNITITEAEVDEEIRQVAATFLNPKPDGTPDVEQWLKMVTVEQGISIPVYRSDSVWPSVALKKLVGQRVEVTDEDLTLGYEANFGPRVLCLAIVMNNLRRAQQVWEKARSNPTPEFFGDLAEEYSIEASSRALRGEVPPIQKHGGQPALEEAVFTLAPGEISSIVQVGPEQYVIALCLGRTDPIQADIREVRDELYRDIYEKKQRLAMATQFEKLQKSATIDNFLAGTSQSPTQLKTASQPSTKR